MNTQPKVYVLLKDLPMLKAGTEIKPLSGLCYGYSNNNEKIHVEWGNEYIENNPEWFKEKQQPIEDRIVVDRIWKAGGGITVLNNKPFFAYHFNANAEIPKEKHEAVKQAIEHEINGEHKCQYCGAWTKQDDKYCYKNPNGISMHNTPQPQDTKEDNPDWEVVSVKDIIGKIIEADKNGRFRYAAFSEYTIEQVLERQYKIHSVRRKSDNEVFTIGDWFTCYPGHNKHKIISFSKRGILMAAMADDLPKSASLMPYYIAHLIKVDENYVYKKTPKEEQKPVLFITDDGYDIFKGDEYWHIISDWTAQMENAVEGGREEYAKRNIKRFSTKEAAEQYILENKPCLSVKDILTTFEGHKWSVTSETLKNLAKSKTNQ